MHDWLCAIPLMAVRGGQRERKRHTWVWVHTGIALDSIADPHP